MKIFQFIISCLLYSCFCDDCIYNIRKTLNVTIPSNEWSLQETQLHSAISATFHFTRPSTFHLIRFRPITAPWNGSSSSCNQWPVGSSTSDPLPRLSTEQPPVSNDGPRLRLANASYLIRTEGETGKRVPLALWADRSVLVLSIVRMMFPLRGFTCPRLEICPVPWGLMMNDGDRARTQKDALCNTVLEKVHAGCLDRLNGVHQVVFPLSHGLAITVDQLGDNPGLYNASLHIVASVGYSLPAGTFTCPEGLFACLPASRITDEDETGRQWQQRICLPRGLRCDGIVNCPNSGSDEHDCHSPAPVQFDVIPDEQSEFEALLNKYSTEQLFRAGYTKPNTLLNTARLSVIGIGALVLVVFVILTVLALWRRRRHQPIHLDTWPYKHSTEDNYASEVMIEPSTKSSSMLQTPDSRFESAAEPLIDRYQKLPRAPLAQQDDLVTPQHVMRHPIQREWGNHDVYSPTNLDIHQSESSKSLLIFMNNNNNNNNNPNQTHSAAALGSSLSHLSYHHHPHHHQSSPVVS